MAHFNKKESYTIFLSFLWKTNIPTRTCWIQLRWNTFFLLICTNEKLCSNVYIVTVAVLVCVALDLNKEQSLNLNKLKLYGFQHFDLIKCRDLIRIQWANLLRSNDSSNKTWSPSTNSTLAESPNSTKSHYITSTIYNDGTYYICNSRNNSTL